MTLSKPPLIIGKEYLFLFLGAFSVLLLSLWLEFAHYENLTRFDDTVIDVEVLKHYHKVKDNNAYSVLKLKTLEGASFYITTTAPLKNLTGYFVKVWVLTKYVGFLDYLKGFATKGNVISIGRSREERFILGVQLEEIHKNRKVSQLYGALFLALPLSSNLQNHFSKLGVSHLLAISGFHLGVLSMILLVMMQWPYRLIQGRYFPHRHGTRDLFIIVASILGVYLLLLGSVPSLLRAYTMLLVGYVLHDRGMKVVSMQTLFITILLILVLFPRLFFSMGFWLSISGVYYIFLYLQTFKEQRAWVSFLFIPLWVYILMTPISLVLFGNYSLYHPLSVLWSILFTLFYPLVLGLHLVGWGALFDEWIAFYLLSPVQGIVLFLPTYLLLGYILLSVVSLWHHFLRYLLLLVAFGVTVTTIYQVA